MRTLADLFEPPPSRWGLRGDPYLWQAMAVEFGNQAVPASESELEALLGDIFAKWVGQPISSSDRSIFVPKFSHGGMSSGHVSPAFWRDTALPLLRERFLARSAS